MICSLLVLLWSVSKHVEMLVCVTPLELLIKRNVLFIARLEQIWMKVFYKQQVLMLNIKCLADSECPLVGFIHFNFLMSYFLTEVSQSNFISLHFKCTLLQK